MQVNVALKKISGTQSKFGGAEFDGDCGKYPPSRWFVNRRSAIICRPKGGTLVLDFWADMRDWWADMRLMRQLHVLRARGAYRV